MEYRLLALGSFLGIFTFICAVIIVRTMGAARPTFTPFNWPRSIGEAPGNSALA